MNCFITAIGQVTAIENKASTGGKFAEKDIVNLSDILMLKLIQLDEIVADGELKQQRGMQVVILETPQRS